VGAVAGGYAGKGIGEMIDPTRDDRWLRDHFESFSLDLQQGDTDGPKIHGDERCPRR
jgi:hypothetical protein